MTGFGRSVIQNTENLESVIEITSVNRKNLDVVYSCPKDWVGLDSILLPEIKKFLKRGRIAVSIRVQLPESISASGWSEESLKNEIERFQEFGKKQNIEVSIDSNLLVQIALNQNQSTQLPEWNTIQEQIINALVEALKDLVQMRKEEGASLYNDFQNRIQALTKYRNQIEGLAGDMVEHYKDRLFERLKSSGLELDLEDERVLKEIALFSDRCDINEELTRLDSHYKQFLETIDTDQSIGRKLEFITQEIGRELNTIGSKSNKLEISKLVIESKNELESVREQVLNVE